MDLDANKIIDNLLSKIAGLHKRIAFLEVENLTIKEELKKTKTEV